MSGSSGPRASASTMRLFSLFVAIAVLMLAACGGSSSTASSSPSAEALLTTEPTESAAPLPTPTVAGTIVFANVVEEESDADICVVKADGTGLKTLAGGPGWQEHPSWSPDGTKIVYDSGSTPEIATIRVCVMNADGTGKAKLTAGLNYHAHWSPDGKRIVFIRYVNDARAEDIFVMNADGSHQMCVVDLKDSDSHPVWVKTGKIIFLRYEDLYSVNPDGSGLVRLTKREDIRDYAISPDGRTLACDTGDRIITVHPNGGGKRVVLLSPKSDFLRDTAALTAWTPDGESLVVAGSDGDTIYGSRLYVVNANGSGLSAVPGIENALDPAWQPR